MKSTYQIALPALALGYITSQTLRAIFSAQPPSVIAAGIICIVALTAFLVIKLTDRGEEK